MEKSIKQSIGVNRNKLLRYKLILELYHKYKTDDIPTAVVYRKYIFPVYPISKTTLYHVLGTPINSELKKLEEFENSQIKLDF
jgi:hypothetical protein